MTTEERQAIIRQRVADLDRLDPQVPIKLRGKDYILELDNAAVKAIFKESGVDLLLTGSLMDITKDPPFNRLEDPEFAGLMLFQALLHHHPAMTQQDADRLWGPRQRLIVQSALGVCVNLFYPDTSDLSEVEDKPKEERKGDPLPLPRAVGSATGPLPEDSEYLGGSSGAAH